jgi:hypothetical protein
MYIYYVALCCLRALPICSGVSGSRRWGRRSRVVCFDMACCDQCNSHSHKNMFSPVVKWQALQRVQLNSVAMEAICLVWHCASSGISRIAPCKELLGVPHSLELGGVAHKVWFCRPALTTRVHT